MIISLGGLAARINGFAVLNAFEESGFVSIS
jgi:hypothetical protein